MKKASKKASRKGAKALTVDSLKRVAGGKFHADRGYTAGRYALLTPGNPLVAIDLNHPLQ